jgi:hypothetical protein
VSTDSEVTAIKSFMMASPVYHCRRQTATVMTAHCLQPALCGERRCQESSPAPDDPYDGPLLVGGTGQEGGPDGDLGGLTLWRRSFCKQRCSWRVLRCIDGNPHGFRN